VKTIAFYLPQFHRVKENDEWWGEGYTDWTAVKKAKQINDRQRQPKVPLNNNYYDLLNKETIKWQATIMKEYGVDGLCFYHYWFKSGRTILEKPAELLLNWKDIDMPFCFSWANESWIRTWSNVRGNVWNDEEETETCKNNQGVLLEQDYGSKKEWEEHFYYLLPFFFDKRYIRVDNKPIIIIYKPDDIPCLNQMIENWKALAVNNGLNGLFVVGTNTSLRVFDRTISVEPQNTGMVAGQLFDYYSTVADRVVQNAYRAGANTYFCGFTGYDDTPRRGRNGKVYLESTPELFYNMMKSLYYIGNFRGNELMFINAWNEWGEGMYLEPDEEFGYGYLQAVRRAQEDYLTINDFEKKALMELICYGDIWEDDLAIQKRNVLFYQGLSRIIDKWLYVKEEGKTILEKIINKKMTIAIYGMGYLGKHLYKELMSKDIPVAYAIDQKDKKIQGLKVFKPDDELIKVDMIIVTPFLDYEIIYKFLNERGIADGIISIEELVNDAFR